MVDWIGLLVPFAYLSILVGSLATFSSLYRRRKATKSSTLAPWFPPHLQRNIYLSLLHLEPPAGSSNAPKVPDSVLKAALLRRATESLRRLMVVRTSKPALQMLLQRGSVGDDLWQQFQLAEKEVEAEVRDVVEEAHAYVPGWGQHIFQSAHEINENTKTKERVAELQAQAKVEREWWDKKKASIQSDFMKELDEKASGRSKSLPAAAADKVGSDEDAVIVEGGGPAASGSKGGTKKKKAKK